MLFLLSGLSRLHRNGPDYGGYYNECFLRRMPKLTWLMRRVMVKGKPVPYAAGEPDFFRISSQYPLPLSSPTEALSEATAVTSASGGKSSQSTSGVQAEAAPAPGALSASASESHTVPNITLTRRNGHDPSHSAHDVRIVIPKRSSISPVPLHAMASLPNKPSPESDGNHAQKNGVPPDYAESSAGPGQAQAQEYLPFLKLLIVF